MNFFTSVDLFLLVHPHCATLYKILSQVQEEKNIPLDLLLILLNWTIAFWWQESPFLKYVSTDSVQFASVLVNFCFLEFGNYDVPGIGRHLCHSDDCSR